MMGVFIETMENVGDDEWRCSICEDKRGSLSAVALHLKEAHDITAARMWVEDDPDWPPAPRMEDRKPVPEENKNGNIIWSLGQSYMISDMKVVENGGKIAVNIELTFYKPNPDGPRGIPLSVAGWVTLDMDRGMSRKLRHELSEAIRKHQKEWF